MSTHPIPPGKLPTTALADLLASFGPPPPEVALAPAVGEDACAVRLGNDVLIAATDPITLTSSDIGRYAVVINANDVAVSGVRPRWFLATVLLPTGTTQRSVEQLFATMRDGLDEVGATLVGGHTEVTEAVNQPVVVGQMLGLADGGHYLSSSGSAPGDVVVQIGTVPIEGAAVLAVEATDRLSGLAPQTRTAAQRAAFDPGISVVDAALSAHRLGATALHDPTEGGLAAGLHELATAAKAAILLDRDQVQWFAPGLQVCRALDADPWASLASGALLATFPPEHHARAVQELTALGHPTSAIGVVRPGHGVHDQDGAEVGWPTRDEVARVLAEP